MQHNSYQPRGGYRGRGGMNRGGGRGYSPRGRGSYGGGGRGGYVNNAAKDSGVQNQVRSVVPVPQAQRSTPTTVKPVQKTSESSKVNTAKPTVERNAVKAELNTPATATTPAQGKISDTPRSNVKTEIKDNRERNYSSNNISTKQPDIKGNQSNRKRESTNNEAPNRPFKQGREEYTIEVNEDGAKKKQGKCRLFVGNLPSDMQESEFRAIFEKFGRVSELFHNQSRGFGFVKLDDKFAAEKAKDNVDGVTLKGRVIRCRFASNAASIVVKNLPMHVSNEYLEECFQQFGQVERSVVIVDEKGKSTGEGIVEFARKPGAQVALNKINDGVFLIGVNPEPIIAEMKDQKDDDDGLPEQFVHKGGYNYQQDREAGARLAEPGSFEYEWGMRWKQLDEMEKQQVEQVKKQMVEAREKLKFEREDAYQEYQTNLMRQDLVRRQEELRRLEEQRQQQQQRRRQMFEKRFSGNTNSFVGQGGDQDMRMQPMQPPPMPPNMGAQMTSQISSLEACILRGIKKTEATDSGCQDMDLDVQTMGGQQQGLMGQMQMQRQSRFDQLPAGFQGAQGGNHNQYDTDMAGHRGDEGHFVDRRRY